MGLFKRLLTYSPRADRTPREDFTTELLCGVLELIPELRRNFLIYLLGLGDNSPRILPDIATMSTQEQLANGKRPDIAISIGDSPAVRIFIEHKIDSVPSFNQLDQYANELGKSGKLFLLTKYFSIETKLQEQLNAQCDFQVIWWHQLAAFFEASREEAQKSPGFLHTGILNEFMKYLKEEEMLVKTSFSKEHLAALVHVRDVMKITDVLLDDPRVQRKFLSLTDKNSYRDRSTRSTQVQNFGRYIVYEQIAGVSETTEYAYILLGIQFDGFSASEPSLFDPDELPCAIVGIETRPKKELSDYLRHRLEFLREIPNQVWKPVNSIETWTRIQATKPLLELSSINHVDELSEWFNLRLDDLIASGFKVV